MYDLAILGAGPAGVAATVYAARKRLNTVLISTEWGGQSTVSDDIQNWIGFPHISGTDLAKSFEAHVREYADDVIDIAVPEKIATISKIEGGFSVTTESGKVFEARAILYGLGSSRRKLPAKGADVFEHKGLTYCASCDGPLFSGRDVVVVGGGNAGFETAAQLLAYTNSVTLLEHNEDFVADAVTVEKLQKNEKFTGLTDVDIQEVHGDAFVTGITYKNNKTGEETTMDAGGVFVEIGMIPNTELVKTIVDCTERGMIKVDPYTQRTNVEGFWAAGDCTDVRYHQNNIAAGDAVKAIEDIYSYLR